MCLCLWRDRLDLRAKSLSQSLMWHLNLCCVKADGGSVAFPKGGNRFLAVGGLDLVWPSEDIIVFVRRV